LEEAVTRAEAAGDDAATRADPAFHRRLDEAIGRENIPAGLRAP
jgi:hypothetical protein